MEWMNLLCPSQWHSKYVAPEVHFSSSTYYTNNEAFFRHLIGKGLKKNSENVIIVAFFGK